MKELKFKTTILCNGCKATVTPFLDKIEGLDEWNVDVESEDKVLTVMGEVEQNTIEDVLKGIGFEANII